MRVLVTGGAGFIGSHLTERLLADGHAVIVLDDLSTGRRENLAAVLQHPELNLSLGSATDAGLVSELVGRADLVFHLAAAVGVRLIVERPVHTIRTNVDATEAVLSACAGQGTPVLLASTSEVYGKGAQVPFREDDDLHLGATTRARWAYACSKALDEWLAFAMQKETGLPVTVARLFNTVGPRQVGHYGMVLPTFARQALAGEPLTVHGDGRQTRSFTHVADVVEALVRLSACEQARGRVVNVGSDREVAIRDLAKLVVERAGSSSPVTCIPYEQAWGSDFEDMRRRVPDVSLLRQLTGFQARRDLPAVVDSVLEFLRKT